MSESTRVRPELHFTVQHGFTNDPHGVVHVDGRYHMFFQYNPDGLNWSPKCHWGHALSDDLLTWDEAEVGLRPEGDEIGCWSGSVAIDERGPAILYTRIAGGDWTRGQIVVARPRRGMFDWVRDPPGPAIDGPPHHLDVVAFRDPQVRREDGKWKAVLGGGISRFGGCALQYSSDDLANWTFDGVIASRSGEARHPVWTGKVWECPQLIRLDDDWVLIMSVWADNVPYSVAYAIGEHDRIATFTAARFGPFTHGKELYATTTFQDARGRPCAMSWLRERGNVAPEGSSWCSAMSLPHVLSIAGDRLTVSQHPALDTALATTLDVGDTARTGRLVADLPGHLWRLRFHTERPRSGGFEVQVAGDHGSFAVKASGTSLVVVGPDGAVLLTMPVSDVDATDVDIVVDADILEIMLTGTEGIASTRIPVIAEGEIRITPDGDTSITDARLSSR